MFEIDRWQEIFSSIRNNMLRTVLSGFTVALGLFIFIVLFGIGTGLQNAFSENFTGDAQNLISIFTNKTSVAYAGLQSDREIVLKNQDYQDLISQEPENIEYSTPNYDANFLVKYGKESGNYSISGSQSDQEKIENRHILEGRYISPADVSNHQYVAVIGRMVQRDLIRNGNPIGKDLNINGTMFKVIGVFSDDGGDFEERSITVPITTLQMMKKNADTLNNITLTYNPALSPAEALEYSDRIEKSLKSKHQVSPDDDNAIIVRNRAKNLEDTFLFMLTLTFIVGFIGLGTLLAGIIGISNIMVYIVKERTQEIGIRKAIGAKPKSIVALILQESVFITVISGVVGVAFGWLTLKLLNNSLEKYFIKDPHISFGLVVAAFFCLVLSGFLAGFVPAYRASKIKPIEALRTE
ncbi:ABC transporter permease [Riemerella columbina]|uniref:ABC transporter permease n=1 Tax=Riemerella columbina TaxID=103810 RepID=UPI00266E9D67|nr:ABC transporter permease [Riemerella columbina]WKS96023.1 ABC transporter permease [Riemerella columbina]